MACTGCERRAEWLKSRVSAAKSGLTELFRPGLYRASRIDPMAKDASCLEECIEARHPDNISCDEVPHE